MADLFEAVPDDRAATVDGNATTATTATGDRRDRTPSEQRRNLAVLTVCLVVGALVIAFSTSTVSRYAACTVEVARVVAAETRYESRSGRFGTATELVDEDFLAERPTDLVVSLIGTRKRSYRIRGTGDCDGFNQTFDSKF